MRDATREFYSFYKDIMLDKQGRNLRHPPAVDPTIGREPHPLFAMNQIGGYPAEPREGDWTYPAQRLRSGRVMFSKETVRRFGIERCQSRIEAETTRPTEKAASAFIVDISWSQSSRSRMRSSHFLNF
jgi:hypothetical protein